VVVEMLVSQDEICSFEFVRIVACYRSFGTIYWFHLQGLSSSKRLDLRRSSLILTVIVRVSVNRHYASTVQGDSKRIEGFQNFITQ